MKTIYLIIGTISFFTILFFSIVTVGPPQGVHKVYWIATNSDHWDIHFEDGYNPIYTNEEIKEGLKTTYEQNLRGIQYKSIGTHTKWLIVVLILSIIGYIREKKLNQKTNT
jgi:hypothetical protein